MMTDIPTALFDLIQAPLRWQVLKAGLDLNLFDHLAPAKGAEEIAACLSLEPRRAAVVLDALCAMGLLDKEVGRYRLSVPAAPYLLSAGEWSLRDMLLTLPILRHGDVAALLRGECGGPPLDLSDPAFWDRSAASLRSFHRGMGADVMAGLLESLPEWPSACRFLDLGAGSETLSLKVAERRPDMAVTVLDLPPLAARIARAVAAAGPAGGRVTVIAGDFNDTDLGGVHDLIWASMTLYYARDLVAVLAKARRALAPGGAFVSFHEGLTDGRTAPETHVVGRLVPALRGLDVSFERGQIAAALRHAGFSQVESRDIETSFGPMVMDIGR